MRGRRAAPPAAGFFTLPFSYCEPAWRSRALELVEKVVPEAAHRDIQSRMTPFFKRHKRSKSNEQAVITHLPWLPDAKDDESLAPIFRLEDQFEVALSAMGAVHDGNEVGGGEVIFYAYGPDADQMFDSIRECLVDFDVRKGAYAIKRYGPVDNPDSSEERVELA